MTWRSDYRNSARAALEAVPRFAGMTILASWAGTIDAQTMPVMGIVTASEQMRPSSSGQFEHETLLQVVIKRQGGDTLEDELDDDDAAVIQAVMAALFTPATPCWPTAMNQILNGDGKQRIGTLVRDFKITSWRPAPGT
ncbi:hypothetical protein [Gemmobacter sp.]|uniref:hypothetical protein n=1 Tax=Gemmobacter sp. TaxID=1898957 RepID=UPI002AFE8E74|nr:hypothetical protein [Gemmobacter sp.]